MRFDDEKRLDVLEAQMKAVQKDMVDVPAKLRKEITDDMDKRFKNKTSEIDENFHEIRSLKSVLGALEEDLKKTRQRVAVLEAQVKKLSK